MYAPCSCRAVLRPDCTALLVGIGSAPVCVEPEVLSNVELLPMIQDVCNKVQKPRNNGYEGRCRGPGRCGGCGSREAAQARSRRPLIFSAYRCAGCGAGPTGCLALWRGNGRAAFKTSKVKVAARAALVFGPSLAVASKLVTVRHPLLHLLLAREERSSPR